MESTGGYKNNTTKDEHKKVENDTDVVRGINSHVAGWLEPLFDFPINPEIFSDNKRNNPIGAKIGRAHV